MHRTAKAGSFYTPGLCVKIPKSVQEKSGSPLFREAAAFGFDLGFMR